MKLTLNPPPLKHQMPKDAAQKIALPAILSATRRVQGLREIRKQTTNKTIEEGRRHQLAVPFSARTHGAATKKVRSTQRAHWPSIASPGPIRVQYRIKSRAWTLTAMSPIVARARRHKGSGSLTSRALKRHQA